MIADQQIEPVFIPVLPSRRKLFGRMVFNSMPGLILIISVIGSHPETIGRLLLSIISVLFGIGVIYFSIRTFRNNGKSKWLGADSVSVFTGLLIIAQGSMIFDVAKGFQPAHLLFAAAAIYIFKGVMLPDSPVNRGITISESEIVFRRSALQTQGPYPAIGIRQILLQTNSLQLVYNDGVIKQFDFKGVSNSKEVLNELQKILIHQ